MSDSDIIVEAVKRYIELGESTESIASKLIEMGYSERDAFEIVKLIHTSIQIDESKSYSIKDSIEIMLKNGISEENIVEIMAREGADKAQVRNIIAELQK